MSTIMCALEDDNNPRAKAMIESWYVRDENAIPSEFVLKALTTKARETLPEAIWSELRAEGQRQWEDAEPLVATALRKGAEICRRNGTLTHEEALVFFRSGTWSLLSIKVMLVHIL